jgi:large subunit ribosomal protein L14
MNLIHPKTRLNVADNTGILAVECIGPKSRTGACTAGQIIKVCVKKATPEARRHWKSTFYAVIVRTVGRSRNARGDSTSFSDNAVVILNPNGEPTGTRVFGPISRAVAVRKVLSMASMVV